MTGTISGQTARFVHCRRTGKSCIATYTSVYVLKEKIPFILFENLKFNVFTNFPFLHHLYKEHLVLVALRYIRAPQSLGSNDLLSKLQDPTQIPAPIGTVAYNLNIILKTIDYLNPHVDVYVMGYYNPFPYYPQEQQVVLLPMLDGLNKSIQVSSKVNGDTFVPTEKVIAKHYQIYIPNPVNIYLSLEGYQAVANQFWKAILIKEFLGYIDRD